MRRILILLAALLVLGVPAWIGVHRLDADLAAMLPAGNVELEREAGYFADLGSVRVLVVEAEALRPDADARGLLLGLLPRLAAVGARPPAAAGLDGLARSLAVVRAHLPELLPPERLAALGSDLEPAALERRCAGLRQRLERPDDWLTAGAVRQDPLGLAASVLGQVAAGPAGAVPDGPLFVHPNGRHLLLQLEIAFPPDDVGRARPLVEVLAAAVGEASAVGVHLGYAGSYRHYVENADTVWGDLTATIPIEVALVGLVLWSLVRSWRALLAIHLPALASVLGALAGAGLWSLATGRPVPMPLLGLTAGILGIAVDYGTHTVSAMRGGHAPHRELLLGYLTTAAAFLCLLSSSMPAMQCLGLMIVVGLGAALGMALAIPPPLITPPRANGLWERAAGPFHALVTARPRWCLTTAAVLTVVSVVGLGRLHFEDDLKRFDGSSRAAWRDLDGFIGRWGPPDSSTFVVATASSADQALTAVAATRRLVGAGQGVLERLLPDAGEQRRRRQAWNVFWAGQADLADHLAAACRAAGLRSQAFAASFASYQPVAEDRPPLTVQDWACTPAGLMLAPLLRQDVRGWTASSSLAVNGPAAVALAASLPADAPGWIANRTDLGRRIVRSVQEDLLAHIPRIAVAVALAMFIAVRRWRSAMAMVLPPATALLWAFGLQGWLGLPMTPFSLLSVTFILGIGIDTAVFLHAGNHHMPAILCAWLTTVLATMVMLISDHPVVFNIAVSLTLGMTAAFAAALLITPALARGRTP